MKFKYIGFVGTLVILWILTSIYWPISLNGSVNTSIVRTAMKSCLFGYSDCKSNIFLRNVTDFEWDTAYLIPYNFSPRGDISIDDTHQKLSTMDFLQLAFFLKGEEVHYELFSYGSPNWFSIIDAVPLANQIIFFDSPIDHPVNKLGIINIPRGTNKYFRCSHESSLKVKKFLPVKDQWLGKIILVVPENCETKYADAIITNLTTIYVK